MISDTVIGQHTRVHRNVYLGNLVVNAVSELSRRRAMITCYNLIQDDIFATVLHIIL